MKIIYIINGMAQSGKDTFVKFVDEELKRWNPYINVVNISSVDPIKEAAKILGYDENRKDEKDRKFLSDLKKLSIEYNDLPFRDIFESIASISKDNPKDDIVFFVHIREPEEIEKVKKFMIYNKYMVKTILVRNHRVKQITSNSSDLGVNNYEYDYQIVNDGTLDSLRKWAETFVYNNIYPCYCIF